MHSMMRPPKVSDYFLLTLISLSTSTVPCLVKIYHQKKKSEVFLVSFVVTVVGITAVNDGDAGGTGKGFDGSGGGDGLTLLVMVTVM